MEKILDIIDSLAHEKGLAPQRAKDALCAAFISSAKKLINRNFTFIAEVDEESKSIRVYQTITVVEDSDERLESEESEAFVGISRAREEVDKDVDLGDEFQIEQNIEQHGRTAAATLYREIEFHVQRAVEDDLYMRYKERVGALVSGRVTSVDGDQTTFIEIDEVRAQLPMKSRIKGEKFKSGDVVSAVVRRVDFDKKDGIKIELSRTSPKFLEELLRLEVPEISDNLVVVERCARIPGERAKIALYSTHPQIDPVGATVGVRGVRINAVSEEILGENIDCIEYTTIAELLITRAMSPAIVSSVTVEGDPNDRSSEAKAVVMLTADQKSKAIGRSGINIRLASMLTGYKIELVELEGGSDTKPQSTQKGDDLSSLEALFGE